MLEIMEAAEGTFAFKSSLSEMPGQSPFNASLEQAFEHASNKAASILDKAKLSLMVGE